MPITRANLRIARAAMEIVAAHEARVRNAAAHLLPVATAIAADRVHVRIVLQAIAPEARAQVEIAPLAAEAVGMTAATIDARMTARLGKRRALRPPG